MEEVFACLAHIIDLLAESPRDWGDPQYDTKVGGGTVFQGYNRPLTVRYVVFEKSKFVIILHVVAYPSDPLAD